MQKVNFAYVLRYIYLFSILPKKYCSSALTAQASKMVITTACVQIDNFSIIRESLSISVLH